MPDVSVIVPLYNQAEYIEETIESLNKQTFKNFEIIVYTHGTTREYVDEILKKFHQLNFKVIDNSENNNLSPKNYAIELAESQNILSINENIKLVPEAIEIYLDCLQSNSNVDAAYADSQSCSQNDLNIDLYLDTLLPYEDSINHCLFFTKSTWKSIDGFANNLECGFENRDFYFRCKKKNKEVLHLNKILYCYVNLSDMQQNIEQDVEKSKLILNHQNMYPFGLIDKVKYEIFKRKGSGKLFFYSNEELDQSKNYIILLGSFLGYQNFGDILQLKGVIKFHKEKTKLIPIVVCDIDTIQDITQIDKLHTYLGVENIIYFSSISYDMASFSLKIIRPITVKHFHLYGGGFLNRYWVDGVLNIAESLINYFNIHNFIISGQQLDEQVADKLDMFFNKYPPLVIGCRDEESFDLLEKKFPAQIKFSFDDAYIELEDIKKRVKFIKEKKIQQVLLHLNIANYVINNDFDHILDLYKETLITLKKRYKNLKLTLLIAYNDLREFAIRDSLSVVQVLEDAFDFENIEVLNLANLAMSKGSILERIQEININQNSFLISSSYHVAMLGKVIGIPVYLFALNDFYRQKQNALDLGCENFDTFLDNLPHKQEKLQQYAKKLKAWEETLTDYFKQNRSSIRHYSYENDVKELFPFYKKSEKYDIQVLMNNYNALYTSWLRKDNDLKNYRWQIITLKEENQKVWENSQKLSQDWKIQETYIKRLEKNNKKIKKVWEEQKNYIERQNQYIQEVEESKTQAWQSVEELKKTWEEQKNYIERQNQHIQEVEESKTQAWQSVEELKKTWEEQKNYIEEQQTYVHNVEATIEKKEGYIQELEKTNLKGWDSYEKIKKAWEEQKNHIEAQQTYVHNVEAAIEKKEAYISELEIKNQELWKETEKFSNAWKEHTEYIKILEDRITMLQDELQNSNNVGASLQKELEVLNSNKLVKFGKKLNIIGEDQ